MDQADMVANADSVRPARRRPREHRRPRGDAEYFRPRQRIDRRTVAGRKVAKLIADITTALGGDDAIDGVTRAQVERIAELTVAAEQARGRMLNGATGPEMERAVKLESELRRAWNLLGQPLSALRPPQPSPGLAIAEARWAEREARAARKATEEAAK
jgi:hypothetical protein